MGRRCISGLAWLLTWRWANRAIQPVDHRPGSRHHDGAATAGSPPVSLATVVALQPHAFIFADVMTTDWQNIVIDHVIIRAVKPGMPAFKTAEQPPKCRFVAVATFPIDQPVMGPVVCFPDPDAVCLAI